MRPSGTTGSGGRILMRGISSLSLSNDPVIYVDGVRVGTSQQTYGQESRGPQGKAAYLLDFVDPRDIDRIEVLRGPATAVRFGLDAASGVILIYTKRGGGV
jgi:TonB-dependent starch-binding outer membrane protein SusC